MSVFVHEGEVALWSPIAIDDARAAAIDALGEVRAIVAPNRYHHLHFNAAAARWPGATCFGPEAPRFEAGRALEPMKNFAFGPLQLVRVEGAEAIDEWVVFDPRSSSLVVTDLVFNIAHAESFMSRVVFGWFAGTLGGPGQSRLWKRFVRDEPTYRASIGTLLDLSAERIVPAHGDVIEDIGLAQALQRGPFPVQA
ncbi:MAG: hypothetical protein AAF399_06510 [Bacteroidota bacterium]